MVQSLSFLKEISTHIMLTCYAVIILLVGCTLIQMYLLVMHAYNGSLTGKSGVQVQ